MSEEVKQVSVGVLASYPWITYVWVLGLAVWGGIVNYITKIKDGTISRFSVTELVGELVTSGFIGFLTFLMCQHTGMSDLVTGVLVGISGHMGARAITLAEKAVESWVRRRFGS